MVLAAIFLAACDLLGLTGSREFVLTAVDGQPLPALRESGTDYSTGLLAEEYLVSGIFRMDGGSRWALKWTRRWYLDGDPHPAFPTSQEFTVRGEMLTRGDTTVFHPYFFAVGNLDGDTLQLHDNTGIEHQAMFTFVRR